MKPWVRLWERFNKVYDQTEIVIVLKHLFSEAISPRATRRGGQNVVSRANHENVSFVARSFATLSVEEESLCFIQGMAMFVIE